MSQQVKQAMDAPVDLREYHPLARLRRIIRAYVVVEGLFLAAILVCLWFWFSVALDFSLQYFWDVDLLDSKVRQLRWVMFGLFSLAVVSVVVWYIFRRLFRDFQPAGLALVLEKRFPSLLGDRLITAVELADLKKAEKQGYSVDMIKKTMRDAKERVDQVPVRTVFNWRRLVLLAWSLVGVSVFVLLLVYPISVLFSLINHQPGRAMWSMLIVNALVALGIVFVFVAPCLFAWSRKATPALRWGLLALVVLCAGSTAAGYYYSLQQINSMRMHEYSWRLYHATDISLDRNIRFMETRWPKDEYFVDWLDFPVESKRIQVNKTINSRAYFTTFIVADSKAPKRWRPLQWSDLPKIVDKKDIPALPLDQVHSYLVGLTGGDERSAVGYDKTTLVLPKQDDIAVDLVLATVGDVHSPFVSFGTDEQQAFANLAGLLNAKATDPKLGGRLIRKVNPPDGLTLNYQKTESGQKGRSKLSVLDERANVFSLVQPVQLNEPTDIYAEASIGGGSIRTTTKHVEMVRAPRVQTLITQEFRPAYYFYLPPTAPRANTIDERRRLMRDLRQAMPPVTTVLPAESFVVPNMTLGSELVLTLHSDKKLQEVTLTPRSAEFPGSQSKDDLFTVPLSVEPDGKTFTVRFTANGKPLRDWAMASWLDALPVDAVSISNEYRKLKAGDQQVAFPLITKTTTFDVVMKDADNMSSSRSFTVRPLDDKQPSVGLYIDVIREIQASDRKVFICTARADIPFAKESVVSDDNGLHKVEFIYEYIPLANEAVVNVRAELAAWLWASSPLMPTIGDYLYRREVLQRTVSASKGPAPIKGTLPLDSFYEAQNRLARDSLFTLEQLTEKLKQPTAHDPDASPVLKRYEFVLDGDKKQVSFDLMQKLPRLTDKDSAGLQPKYDLTLNVRVTDSNVIGESDRTAENKEAPLVFRIVGEQELYALIAREEAKLVDDFDKMIARLESNQRVLQQSVTRLPSLSPTTSVSEQTRVEGVMDVVGKAKEQTGEIHAAYRRIQREYEVNRFPDQLTRGLSMKIIEPLREVQAKEFLQAEEELVKFHVGLKEGDPQIVAPLAPTLLFKMHDLIEALRKIRNNMGDTIGYNKAVLKLKAVRDGQVLFTKEDIERMMEELQSDLLQIKIKEMPSLVTIDAGKTAKVQLKVRMPDAPTGDLGLRFEIPTNSELKINPTFVPLKEDSTATSFEITAGTKTGNFSVLITPSQGKPVELKVVVK